MYELMLAYEQSGQRREVFCEAHNLKLATFSYWRTKYLSAQRVKPGFVSLIPSSVSGDRIELSYGEVVLRLGPGVSADYLAALIKKLGSC